MAITEGATIAVSGADGSATTHVSGSFDSTGGGGILYFVAHEGAPTSYTWSDNKSTAGANFVTLATRNMTSGGANGDFSVSAMFCHTPNVGTGHTITCTFGASRPFRYGGGIVLNGTFSSTFLAVPAVLTAEDPSLTATVDAGSLVTDATAYLVQFAANYNGIATSAAGSGWAFKSGAAGSRHFQTRNEATSGTFDPAFTLTAAADWVTIAAAIKETAGGGGGTTQHLKFNLLGVG